MHSIKKILVGVDFNEQTGELPLPTREAISKAIRIAAETGSELTLMSVLSEDTKSSDLVLEELSQLDPHQIVRDQLKPYLEQCDSKNVQCRTKNCVGRAWQELIKEVLREDIDLLIIGTREKTSAQSMLYGSTALKVLRKCPCPVWVTRPDVTPFDDFIILAADDLGETGKRVLETSVAIGQLMSARLVVVHSVDFPFEGALKRTEVSVEEIDKYKEKVRSEAEKAVNERLAQTDYRTLEAGTRVVIRSGPADTVIDQVAEEEGADLLVMGTVGRGGIPGFLIGNTAERLLRELRCSVLALKPDGFVCPIRVD
ncbi:universal stress protein [Thalassoglobus neptunius]|nr:universal stress protein [Thalassoglobus neptunius]